MLTPHSPTTLSNLHPGEIATIVAIHTEEPLHQRLLAMGFRSGKQIELIQGRCVHHAAAFRKTEPPPRHFWPEVFHFGEMAFLDGDMRSADAVAFFDTDLYVLSRKTFDSVAKKHKKLALSSCVTLARDLA